LRVAVAVGVWLWAGDVAAETASVSAAKLVVSNVAAGGAERQALVLQLVEGRRGGPGAAATADPRCGEAPPGTARATLRVFSNLTGQDTGVLPLPCERWRAIGTASPPRGYRYEDGDGVAGPCRKATIKPGGAMRASCRTAGPTARLDYDLRRNSREGQVFVEAVVGDRVYRVSLRPVGRRDGRDGRRFVGKRAADVPWDEPAGIPPEVVRNAAAWPLPNRDYASSRAAGDSAITAATIGMLAVAWRFPTPGAGGIGNLSTTPIVVDDTVYLQELSSEVHAIDLATGTARWSVPLEVPSPGPNGVAVAYGRVFAANGQGEVVALDAATGAELWRTALRRTSSEGIDIQPVVFDRRLYLSTVPISFGGIYTGGDTGVIHALDVQTGAVLWRFDTVDSADVWGNPEVNSGGGAWFPPAIDTSQRMTYWGTGNPAPFPGTEAFPNGSSRPGPNLYTNAVLALGAADGLLAWYNQVAPHDLLDHDFHLVALASVGSVPVVVGAGKTGTVHVFDRATGSERWRRSVGVHFNDDLPAYPIGTSLLVSPGIFGGVITPPAVADETVYVSVLNFASPFQGDRMDPFAFGGLDTATAELVALDLASGTPRWAREFSRASFGAATVVGDLVLTSTNDGTVYAFERASGAPVWSDRPGGGINAWPAVAGRWLLVPAGVGATPELVAYRLP